MFASNSGCRSTSRESTALAVISNQPSNVAYSDKYYYLVELTYVLHVQLKKVIDYVQLGTVPKNLVQRGQNLHVNFPM